MTDIFSSEKRSEIMSNVKTQGTDIEEILGEIVKEFWQDYKYHKNVKNLPGTPDVLFLKKKIAVFADGDFWHGKDFEEWRDEIPDFWENKIKKNIERDERQTRELEKMGYGVLRFWGSELKKNPEMVKNKIQEKLYK